MSNQIAETIISSNGYSFRRTTWNGISVIQEISSGYYNAADACRESGKLFANWKRNKKTSQLLEFASRSLELEIEGSLLQETEPETYTNLSMRIRIDGLIVEIHDVDNEMRGTYIHPDVFHSFAEWISSEYAFKVSRLMNLLNERNKLTHQTLEQTIENYKKEIEALKTKNESKNHILNELEAELVSRAAKIDDLESEIHDLTTPIDKRFAPPTAYAKAVGNDYFQLKQSASILGPSVPTLRRESFVGADDCVKQVKRELKNRNLFINVDGNKVIERSHLDETFDLLHRFKERSNNEITARNEWLDNEIARLKALPNTAQREGKIFELEYIRQHEELTPWALVPIDLKNQLNEMVKDTGIDAVVIEGRESNTRADGDAVVIERRESNTRADSDAQKPEIIVTKIVQMKYKRISTKPRGNDVRSNELTSFISKSQQPRYQAATKLLVTKNCVIGPRMRRLLESNSISIESY